MLNPPKRPMWAGEFAVCPGCGSEGGFHLVLERMHEKTEAVARGYLKCPACQELFDVGLKLHLV